MLTLTKGATLRFVREGKGLPEQAGWPMIRFEVSDDQARARLNRHTIVIPNTTGVQTDEGDYQFGRHTPYTLFRFELASPESTSKHLRPVTQVELVFARAANQIALVADALTQAGFELRDSSGNALRT